MAIFLLVLIFTGYLPLAVKAKILIEMDRTFIKGIRIVFLFLIASANTFSQDNKKIYACRNGIVNFISDAPLELIKASNNKLAGVLNITDRSFSFQIPVKAFDGFNSSLQKVHFNEDYLETELFPNSTFRGRIIEEVDLTIPGSYNVRAKGKLSIHGVEIDRIVRCDLAVTGNNIKVNANFTVFIADHNISIPSILNQKIAEEVKVNVSFTFIPSAPSSEN